MDSLVPVTSKTISLPNSPSLCFASRPPWLLSLRKSISSSAAVTMLSPFPSSIHLLVRCNAVPLFARKRASESQEPALQPSIIDELADVDEEDDLLLDDDELDDEELFEDDFEDEYMEDEDAETCAGDGAGGGGILLAGTWWDKEALSLAEQVSDSFDRQLTIYAFRTLANSTVQVRIENISTKSGSPSISDIEAFSKAYRELLDKAEEAKSVPENIYLEVSSPGVERVVRVPQDLDRFKERSMLVKYVGDVTASNSSRESEGVFRLISFDLKTSSCIWGLADVKINREKAGKGRPMNKKQREWRLTTPFDSLLLVRLYSEA
ncbi:hypothetical protein V2J09_019722 [Rumex salicifolius]